MMDIYGLALLTRPLGNATGYYDHYHLQYLEGPYTGKIWCLTGQNHCPAVTLPQQPEKINAWWWKSFSPQVTLEENL